MRDKTFIEMPKAQLAELEQSLAEKIKPRFEIIPLSTEEKINLNCAIQTIQFSPKFIYAINEETAHLLAQSSHPVLKEWGQQASSFYASDINSTYVDKSTGMIKEAHIKKRDYGYQEIIHPEEFSSLISPLHVAALIGDKELVEHLYNTKITTMRIDKWTRLSHLEVALKNEHAEIVDFIFKTIFHEDLNQLFKWAFANSSMNIIKLLLRISWGHSTDEAIEEAKVRDPSLYQYLNILRKSTLAPRLAIGPLKALESMFSSGFNKFFKTCDDTKLITEFICEYPEVVNDNTLLHRLIITQTLINPKDTNHYTALRAIEKVNVFMTAIFAAQKVVQDLPFDMEKTNKDNKTVLQVALDHGSNDVTAAIILYGNPKISPEQQKQIEQFIPYYCNSLAQDNIKLKRGHDKELSTYLETRQKIVFAEIMENKGTLGMLNILLDFPEIFPAYQFEIEKFTKVITDFICTYPEVIQMTLPDGNTALHQAVSRKNTERVKGLLCGIFEAAYRNNGLKFDIEKTNNNKETVLDLALKLGNDDITAAIILYGNPKKSVPQEELIQASTLNLASIDQQRSSLQSEMSRKTVHMQQKMAEALVDTIKDEMDLREKQVKMEHNIYLLIDTVKTQEEQIAYQQQQIARLVRLTEALLIDNQAIRNDYAELRALLQSDQFENLQPPIASAPRILNRNNLFAITAGPAQENPGNLGFPVYPAQTGNDI